MSESVSFETFQRVVTERDRLAEQGVRERELIQQITTQRDDAVRLLSQERAAQERATEAVRSMQGSDAILRAQVAGLEKLRDGYAKELAIAMALVRDMLPGVHSLLGECDRDDPCFAMYDQQLARARALLDGAA